MPNFPSLSEPPKTRHPLVTAALSAVVIGLVAGGGYWLGHRADDGSPSPAPSADAPPPSPAPTAALDPSAGAPPASELPPSAPMPAPAPAAPTTLGVHAFSVSIRGPLESAIVSAAGKEEGTALTQVVTRSLVWWLRVPQDLLKGDTLSVVYETRDGQEPLVMAVRLQSRKLDKTLEAFRYQPAGAAFARTYQADGSELEERLIDGPLDSYEQITSLLRDGRRHRGVDFKTPVGTPIKSTFDGVVTRKTWNFRSNGNSVEIQESGGQGRKAMYLHLSELASTIRPGRAVKKGELLGKSGNTGHSFAPHLHYQLMKNETVVDPFTSHKTTRSALPATERVAFEREAARLKALWPAVALAGG
jgi:murein DD-endopeptidase MepM/ murein hydrolase activator NlpD